MSFWGKKFGLHDPASALVNAVGFAKTDVGCVRQQNEDNILYYTPSNHDLRSKMGILCVVADGMGGHAAGEVASKTAIEEIQRTYYQASENPMESLTAAFKIANEKIWYQAQQNIQYQGMGTTCTALVVLGDRAIFTHIGDSRIYRLRADCLVQLTQDHTLREELKATGSTDLDLTPTNILSRAMGIQLDAEFQISKQLKLAANDRFLLCSDGLYDLVSDAEINQLLGLPSPELACDSMIALAKHRGGHDNISTVIVEISKT